MRYFISALWVFILSAMSNYVVSSMSDVPFHIDQTVILGTLVTLAIWFLPAILKSHDELSE